MKRATITFPDALERKLEAYLAQHRTPPTLSTVVQVALDEYLENQKWIEYDIRPARGPFAVTVAEEGSGEPGVSANHHSYSAGAIYQRKVARANMDTQDGERSLAATGTSTSDIERDASE